MRALWIVALLGPVALADGDAPDLRRAVDLPLVADHLRSNGVPEEDMTAALDAAKGADLSAGDTTDALQAADDAVAEHGPIDNFGAFVQEQLAAGKRGQELADAIKTEHESRGKGKPEDTPGNGKPAGKPGGGGGGKSKAGPGQGGGKPAPGRGGR